MAGVPDSWRRCRITPLSWVRCTDLTKTICHVDYKDRRNALLSTCSFIMCTENTWKMPEKWGEHQWEGLVWVVYNYLFQIEFSVPLTSTKVCDCQELIFFSFFSTFWLRMASIDVLFSFPAKCVQETVNTYIQLFISWLVRNFFWRYKLTI